MLITFSTVEAVKNHYQNDLLICWLIAIVFLGGSFFVPWKRNRQIGWKWSLLLTCLFLLVSWYLVRSSTIDNFVEAKIEADSVSLKFANSEPAVVLNRNQLLDVSVGFGGKHKSSCYLIVAPKEGWHYDSAIISNSCSDCEKYRDQALSILKLPKKMK